VAGVSNRGLNRWGIATRSGLAMEGRVALRGDVGDATVALQTADGTLTYASQRLPVSADWRRVSFRLVPRATDPNARFAVLFDRKGTLWVDQATLLDGDRFHGLPVRGDIARALVDERLTILRYGGTMVNVPAYRWKSMIGDPDRRPPYAGNWYPYSTNAFGIFDFLRLCEAAGCAAAFAINAEETPEDAADLADYLTAPTTTYWGGRRAADGHPVPYHPEFIEIGNEEAIGETNHANLAHYAERFRLLEKAIHGRNPALGLVCAAWWAPESPDMQTVFDAVDGKAVAWDFHFWSDDANAGEGIDGALTRAERLFKTWNPKTNLKVVVFEENGNRHDLQRALGHATTLNATRRHGHFVLADCAANCLQPWHQNDNGWDQGQIFFTPDHVWRMPPADATWMLSVDRLPLRVEAQVLGDLDVLASRSEDGKTIVLTVVNSTDRASPTAISLGGFHARAVRVRTLSGELTAVNAPDGPALVSPREERMDVRRVGLEFTFPAHSLTSLRYSR
jgi:alpha-L-arabinofuranosidase